jgi:hypothetical protein
MKTRTELAATWPPTADVARDAGHQPQSPLAAIRAKCVDCSGGSPSEARRCEAVDCPLWPFRSGLHPWHGATLKKTGQNRQGFHEGDPFYERPSTGDDRSTRLDRRLARRAEQRREAWERIDQVFKRLNGAGSTP